MWNGSNLLHNILKRRRKDIVVDPVLVLSQFSPCQLTKTTKTWLIIMWLEI